ncbi:MAG: polysaccharide pyruvyl transferase CsaB [Candidatus Velthaea sp.]
MALSPRFLLSGYYGFGNVGDEALLAIIVERLRARWPSCSIDVLSNDPAGTAGAYAVQATPRADLGRVRKAIARADVVLSGGGGLLQNVTSLRSLLYYAGIIRSAIRARKRTMVFAQSVGPLDFWGKAVVRQFCRGLDAATVRDERSRAVLAPLLSGTPVERTADPVFLFEPGSTPLDLTAEGLGPGSDPLAVVSVRPWTGADTTAAALAVAVDRLTEEHGLHVAFLPLGGAPDAETSTAVIRKCRTSPVLLPHYSLPQAAQVIGRSRLVVGMRLHALIIAARLGVPFSALPYDPKVAALLDDLAYPLPPLFVPGDRVPPNAVIERRIDEAWARRDELAGALRAAAPAIAQLAQRNFDVLDELVTKAATDDAGAGGGTR